MSWDKDHVLAFLAEETRLGRLATVSADGVPHVVPIWFRVVGDRLHVHTFAESRKARNIAATGRFSLTADKDTLPYKGATVGGRAEVVTNDVVDSIALVKELAVAYAGPEVGAGMGGYIAGMPGEHVTLVLHVDEMESWDYS
jgi:PPOX class probable F420-dependent enzyme